MEKLNCSQVQQQIAEATREQLRHGLPRHLTSHIESCQSCQRYYDEVVALDLLLGNVAVPAPSKVTLQIGANVSPSKNFFSKRLAILLAALVAMLCLLAFVYHYYYQINVPQPDDGLNMGGNSQPVQPKRKQSRPSPAIQPHN